MKKLIYYFFFAIFSFLSCSSEEVRGSRLGRNFFYNPSKSDMLEEFKYEWVFSDNVFPWEIYYGLAFWRPKTGENVGFTIPYFLIKNQKDQKDFPPSFIIKDTQGTHWHFKSINDEKDLYLSYLEQKPTLLEDFQSNREEEPKLETLEEIPFKGRVYILDYEKNQPFDWALLRILYENSIDQDRDFTFIWEEPCPFSYHENNSIVEPDKTIFTFHWEKEGFQTFMKALKEWGIS